MITVLEKDQNCNDLLAETLIDLMITFFSNIGDIDDRLYFKILNHFIHFTKSKNKSSREHINVKVVSKYLKLLTTIVRSGSIQALELSSNMDFLEHAMYVLDAASFSGTPDDKEIVKEICELINVLENCNHLEILNQSITDLLQFLVSRTKQILLLNSRRQTDASVENETIISEFCLPCILKLVQSHDMITDSTTSTNVTIDLQEIEIFYLLTHSTFQYIKDCHYVEISNALHLYAYSLVILTLSINIYQELKQTEMQNMSIIKQCMSILDQIPYLVSNKSSLLKASKILI